MSIKIWIASLLLLMTTEASAQSIEPVLGQPRGQPAVEGQLILPVYFYNNGETVETISIPDHLTCRLSSQGDTMEITARRADPVNAASAAIDAKGYLKTLYSLTLPPSLMGTVRLLVPDLGQAGIVFTVENASPTFKEADAQKSSPPEQKDEKVDLSAFIELYQPYAKNISFYQPMYFLVGTDPKNSKFQISFKYRFFDPEKRLVQKHPWVQGIHFAYTQTSFWDLASASKPFEDTSYKPEFFYQTQNIDTGIDWLKGCFLKTGLQHESNGLGGETSRSTNFAYVEPSFILLNEKKLTGLKISPRFQLYVANDDSTNADLSDYRGYWDLRLTFGGATGLIVDSYVRWADAGGSALVDVTYPLHRLLRTNVDLYLQVEYVNALAESLLHYTDRTEALRIGLAIVR